jgi:hypothetical protein
MKYSNLDFYVDVALCLPAVGFMVEIVLRAIGYH